MELEFELKTEDVNHTHIRYAVLRKGFKVGVLTLEEPYTIKEARGKALTIR